MTFTMKYTAHPERKTAFTKAVEQFLRIHALIPKASPWRNDIIERSNRTDNEELFHQFRFSSSKQRRYWKFGKLWQQTKVSLRLVITYFNWVWRHSCLGTTAAQRAELASRPWTWNNIAMYPTLL